MSGDNVNRDLGAGEGGAVSVVEEEEEDGDEDKLKDDLNRSQSPSAMSQSSNYLEWDPSADVGALSTMPGSSSSGGRGRADELYLGEHFDTPESPEIKVLYGPKNLLRSNPSSSNQLYCYSTPQSSRTSRVTFSSFDCSPIDIQSPPEYHESTPSTEVSAKESHVKTSAYTRPATGRPQVIKESDSEATDSSPTYQSVAGTVGSSSVQKESDIGIDSQSPPELKESDGAVEKKSGATVTYSSTDDSATIAYNVNTDFAPSNPIGIASPATFSHDYDFVPLSSFNNGNHNISLTNLADTVTTIAATDSVVVAVNFYKFA